MNATGLRYALVLMAMILATAVILAIPRENSIGSAIDVRMDLPERVGSYVAHRRLFCQRETCMRTRLAAELVDPTICPDCGGEMGEITLAEKRILPTDTIIRKRQYVDDLGRNVFVSLVVSGAEQKSLHRPQQCLPAQGYVIDSSRKVEVPLHSRDPLPVALLKLRWRGDAVDFAYAYWFMGGGRETASHLQRLFWMSYDRILRGVATRWAYITVSLRGEAGRAPDIDELERFIGEFYPQIRAES